MAGAIIVIDQPGGAGAGSPGVSRRDLWQNKQINLSCAAVNGSYAWDFLDVPPGSAAVLANAGTATPSFTPDLTGSYRVQLVTNGGGLGNVQILVMRVRFDSNGVLQRRGWSLPAFGEQGTEANYEGNLRGYAPDFEYLLADLEVALGEAAGGPGGALTVATVAELAELGTGLLDGTTVTLTGVRRSQWTLAAVQTERGEPWYNPADDTTWVNYAPANDGRMWWRDRTVGTPGSVYQATWYIDAVNGDDANDGTSAGTALATLDEFQARIGQQLISIFIYVTLLSDITSSGINGGAISLQFNFKGDNSGVAFIGQKTVLQTYTISGAVPWDDASGTAGSYALTGTPDLTSYLHKFVRISVGANTGGKAVIAKTPTAGTFRANFSEQNSYTAVEPEVGDTVQIYDVTNFGQCPLVIDVRGEGGVYFQDCALGAVGSSHSITCQRGLVFFIACQLHGLDVYRGCDLATINTCATYDLRVYGAASLYGTTHFTAGGAACSARASGLIEVWSRILVQGAGITAGDYREGSGCIIAQSDAPIAILDYAVEPVVVYPGGLLVTQNALWISTAGAGGLNGYHVYAGGKFFYKTGYTPVSFATAPATFARVGGTSKTQVQLPYFELLNGAAIAIYE